LDGEKTSKIRYAFPPLTSAYKTVEDLNKLRGSFEGEAPAQSLESFRGTLKADGEVFNLVDSKQLLYRGAKLMNTERVWGLVAYAGQCSKIMLNSQLSSSKISSAERKLNIILYCLFLFQLICCFIFAAMAIHKDRIFN
jgi:magnesium-transporting ATPase (P-type)